MDLAQTAVPRPIDRGRLGSRLLRTYRSDYTICDNNLHPRSKAQVFMGQHWMHISPAPGPVIHLLWAAFILAVLDEVRGSRTAAISNLGPTLFPISEAPYSLLPSYSIRFFAYYHKSAGRVHTVFIKILRWHRISDAMKSLFCLTTTKRCPSSPNRPRPRPSQR